MKKRGISPVIATVLLVLLGFILVAIILIWAKSFINEKIEKFGEPIENACENVNFDAEVSASEGNVGITNRGNVPLYGVEIRKKGIGSLTSVGIFEENTITIGDSGSIPIDAELSEGDEVVVVPIILGESGEAKKSYTCKEQNGVETEVIA